MAIQIGDSSRDGMHALGQRQASSTDESLQLLMEKGERDQHFADVKELMALNPPDDAYFLELKDWESDVWS